MSAENDAAAASGRERMIPDIWRGLFWREWLAHRNLVLWSLCAWLVGGWVLMIFYHPGWIIGVGVVYAMIAGRAFGGGDTIAGTEEFTVSLPPLRGQQYLARLVLACGTTLAFTGLGALAIAFDLPQRVWGLVVESGFTEPFPACDPPWLYGLAIGAPFLTLAITFSMSATAKSRGAAVAAAIVGVVGTGAVIWLAFGAEYLLWEKQTGLIVIPAPLAAGVMMLLYGYGRYVRKEAVARPSGTGVTSAIVIVVVVVVVLLLAFMLLWSGAPSRPGPPGVGPTKETGEAAYQRRPLTESEREVEKILRDAAAQSPQGETRERPAPSATTAPARTEETDKGGK